jgi:type III secretory pathway component EscS
MRSRRTAARPLLLRWPASVVNRKSETVVQLSDQLFEFAVLLAGTLVAVVITLMIASAAGWIKLKPNAGALEARTPELRSLPGDERQRIARRATRHPLVWGILLAAIASLVWLAVANAWIIDLINSSWRVAAVIGIVVMVVLVKALFLVQDQIVRRQIRRYRSDQKT